MNFQNQYIKIAKTFTKKYEKDKAYIGSCFVVSLNKERLKNEKRDKELYRKTRS